MSSTQTPGRVRMIALRIVASVFVLIGLVVLNGSLLIAFLAGLPVDTLLAMGIPPGDANLLVYDAGLAMGSGALLLCVALQVRRPDRNVAALWLVIFFLGTQIVYDATQGTVGTVLWAVVYALFLALVALHPRRFAPVAPLNRTALVVGIVGAVPLLAYAWNQLQQQTPSAGNNFHFGMALVAALGVVAAGVGSTALPGRRVAAWIGGAVAVLLAVVSIAHSAQPAALPVAWAWVVLVWGVAFIIVSRPPAVREAVTQPSIAS